jgi:ABC-type transport system involved in multi-copper enzyme maturation permease subunit
MPQPRVSLWWKALASLSKLFAGLLLVYVSIAFIVSLLQRPETQAALLGIAILLGVLWGLWSLLPVWLQRVVRWCLRRNKEDKHDRKR